MKVTALMENTAVCENVATEHGLSLYIETKDHNILFDMGQTELFSENAKVLGVDLQTVDIAILSHGHYDHGGGLRRFLEINQKAPVYVNHYAFEPHYHGKERYIGLDVSLKESSRLIVTGDKTLIDKGITIFSCNEKKRMHDLGSFGLYMEKEGCFLPDDFRHEQYLLLEENGKRALVSGCSHKGILDLVQWFRPHILIGGFHFSTLPLGKELEEYARFLNDFDTEYYTCHCTGKRQFEFMKHRMEKIHYLSCGQCIEL